jgi:hypothetical protein
VCEFSANVLWVRTVWDDEDADTSYDENDLSVYDSHPTLSERPYTYKRVPTGKLDPYGREYTEYKCVERDNPHYDAERWQVCEALSDALTGGAFDNVLLDLFGDHATITIDRGGITIESYDHD